MTDRELLELAAKAAGVEEAVYVECVKDYDSKDFGEPALQVGHSTWHTWNPLTDDGDALRLWVKLKLDISFGDVSFFDDDFGFPVTYWREAQDVKGFVLHENDPYAATRRAIVRAAAEIGKAMQ